ncbi:MAG: membrane dipeptidase [bacterium]
MPVSREAQALHDDSFVIDLHGDTLMVMSRGYDFFKRHRPLPLSAFTYHIDEPRMRDGGQDAQVFGLVTWPFRARRPFASALRQMDRLHRAAASRPDALRVVTEAAELEAAREEGVRAGLFGLEGVHALEGELKNLDPLAARGLRLCGLSHFSANEAAYPAIGLGKNDALGLTRFGCDVVDRCHDLGLVVDLAHINKAGFLEAARRSRDPVLVSHTGVTGAKRHVRNIDDEQIRAVADTGGAIGIIFAVNYVGFRGGVDAVVNHIVHCIDVGGEDCPALGSDFDGAIIPVRGLPDAAALPNLTEALLRRGLKPAVIRKVLGENVLRVLRAIPWRGNGAGRPRD